MFTAFNTLFPSVIPFLSPEQLAEIDVQPPNDDLSNHVNALRYPSFDTSSQEIPDTEIQVYNTTVFCEPASENLAFSPPSFAPSADAPSSAPSAAIVNASAPAASPGASAPVASAQLACAPDSEVVHMAAGSMQELLGALSASASACRRVVSLDSGPKCVPRLCQGWGGAPADVTC